MCWTARCARCRPERRVPCRPRVSRTPVCSSSRSATVQPATETPESTRRAWSLVWWRFPWAGRWTDRHGRRWLLVGGAAAFAVVTLGHLVVDGLVGLVVLILGGIGVSSVTRVFVQQKMKAIAVLKCVGARSSQLLAVLSGISAAMATPSRGCWESASRMHNF